MRTDEEGETPNLPVLMFVAHRFVEERVLRELVAHGHTISLAQARVFQRVDPAGTRLTELAARAQVTKQTAGFLVDQLQAEGYLRRAPDPTDARARLVQVAPRGRAAAAIAERIVAEVEAQWEAHLGVRRMERLRKAMADLRVLTDPFA